MVDIRGWPTDCLRRTELAILCRPSLPNKVGVLLSCGGCCGDGLQVMVYQGNGADAFAHR